MTRGKIIAEIIGLQVIDIYITILYSRLIYDIKIR